MAYEVMDKNQLSPRPLPVHLKMQSGQALQKWPHSEILFLPFDASKFVEKLLDTNIQTPGGGLV